MNGVGIAPLPIQRPIPVWFGGASSPAYARMGRLADGWFPMVQPGPKLDEARADHRCGGPRGRARPGDHRYGGTGRLAGRRRRPRRTRSGAGRDVGATHLSINTMRAGLATVEDHLDALARVSEALQLG